MDRTAEPDDAHPPDRPRETGAGRDSAEAARRRPVSNDPRLDGHQRQGISGTAWVALILGLIILVLLLVFILQNNVPADFRYLGWTFSLPLGVAMLLAAVAGALVTALVGSVRVFRLGHRVRRLEKERESIKRSLG